MFPQYEYIDLPLRVNTLNQVKASPTRFHKHLELMLVHSGTLEVCINKVGYTLQAGDMYLVFPNLPHSLSASPGSVSVMLLDSELFTLLHKVMKNKIPACPVFRKGSFSPAVYTLVDRMHQITQQKLGDKQTLLTVYANALLGELICQSDMVDRRRDNDLLHRMSLYILEHYTQEITLDKMARELNYNKFYISHLISNIYNCNFRSLINSYRVSLARHLLASGNSPISEVAYACGFKNQSTFNRIFMEHCQTTPSAYRQKTERPPKKPDVFNPPLMP